MVAPIGLVLPWLTTPLKPMNYIHAENSIVIEYPYSLEKMRSDNPQTSFPREMSAEELAEWGVFAVEEQAPPAFSEQTELIELQPPSLVNGVWVQGWVILDASDKEMEQRKITKSAEVRKRRNRLLSETDYSQISDFQGSEAEKLNFAQFRQQLRDLPQQEGFPFSYVWPNADFYSSVQP